MQAIMETIFDVLYLGGVLILGIIMLINSKNKPFIKTYGIMSIILALGDSFHLVPRMYGLIVGVMDEIPQYLGFGKFVTSVTMTVFYVMLFHAWMLRYKRENSTFLQISIYLLAAARIALCFFPQNDWLSANPPLIWGIIRNVPFVIMGTIIIVIFAAQAKRNKDMHFKYMWLCILLSFLFYIPVVLFAGLYPMVGMLMLPKTVMYFLMVLMGFRELNSTRSRNGILN